MTRQLRCFSLVVLVSISISNAVYAQFPAKNETPFCGDPKWRPGEPCDVGTQGSSKEGEPRTVRLVYFVPNDRAFRAEVVQRMKDEIRAIQTFYGNQMEAHGYGNRTFGVEIDSRDEPMVHVVNGEQPDSGYIGARENAEAVFSEIDAAFNFRSNVYLIVIDNSTPRLAGEIDGLGKRYTKVGGSALVTDEFHWAKAAHELGHAFGLEHNFHDGGYIMSYGPGYDQLSACSAESLAGHPYFNPDAPIEQGTRPTIELVSPRSYPAGSQNISIELKFGDSDGLLQALLLARTVEPHSAAGQSELKAYRGLEGDTNALVQFDYDGVIPSNGLTNLSNPFSHPITIQAIDTEGNWNSEEFTLVELSPSHIVTLEGHTDRLNSVSFSPDHTTFASASDGGTVKLWDVETLENIATLEEHTRSVRSLSFSPDGRVLASGSWDGAINLWNTETRETIGVLRHNQISFVSFSPDGRTLASGARDGSIKLWNVAKGAEFSTLRHAKVTSASFSSDGRTFATAGWDKRVKIWDLVTRSTIATLETFAGGFRCVSYSPDGSVLAAGAWNEGVQLWDATTHSTIGTLEHKWITSMSFSPDGKALASGGRTTIKLWDVASGENLTTLRHAERVTSVSFSPDGSPLVSGMEIGTVELWDTSEWVQSVKFAVPDPNLRAAIASALGMPRNARIRRTDVASLTKLGARKASIRDLTGLEWATNLKTLILPNNSISDLSPLKGLIHLSWIDLGGNSVSDISPLAGLTELRLFFAAVNRISDISPLAGLTDLTFAILNRNSISDLSPLVANTGLGREDAVQVRNNPLSYRTIHNDIPMLRGRGLRVEFTKQAPRAEDVNRDGSVDILDLVIVASGFGNERRNSAADVNGDGVVNIQDLVLVAAAFDDDAAAPPLLQGADRAPTAQALRGWLNAAKAIEIEDATVARGIGTLERLLESVS
ncbi:MAG: dockerin type I domain-containing protein, partial [Candidatus Poribacteria bacterium]|nr:dockerin type I domain-containing protein [Candidatus Poribacteria bacterium]